MTSRDLKGAAMHVYQDVVSVSTSSYF